MPQKPARPTIYDVAERAGVSKSLVSLVLRGQPRVAPATRAAVQSAITELGYRPSRAATTLAGRRTRTLGVVVDDFRNPWFVDLLQGLRDVLDSSGFHIAVADRTLNAHVGVDPVEGFLAQNVDALILAGVPVPASAVPPGTPVVVAGSPITGDEADAVANDDEHGARLVAQHLLGLGHRSIGHLAAPGSAAAARRSSFEQALADTGHRPVVFTVETMSEPAGYQATSQLLADRPDVTALFAANDALAVGALAAARDRGLDVPGDLSVVGYDNAPLAQSHLVTLTTVDGRNREVGAGAGRAVLARLAQPERAAQRTLIEPALVERSSTARPHH